MRFNSIVAAALIAAACAFSTGAAPKAKKKATKAAATRVIYTGDIAKKVIGYQGTTPLNITVVAGRITAIEPLPNHETPRFFQKATAHVLPQYIGKTLRQAASFNADIATGATYSSKALIGNIKLGAKNAMKRK